MVTIYSITYAESKRQGQQAAFGSAQAAFAGTSSEVGSAAREIVAAPYLASVVLRVVAGLALGFWLVQMVKISIG